MKQVKKLMIAAILCAAIGIFAATGVFAAYLGDVNGDNAVRSNDARLILRHAAKLSLITDENALLLADINQDNRVNSADARLALRMASKLQELIEYNPAPAEPTTTPAPSAPPTIPSEPKTDAPDAPTTLPVPVEPTTNGPSGNDPANIVYHNDFYVDADILTYDENGNADVQSIKVASASDTVTGALKKTYDVNTYYVRTSTFMPGHDIGVMIKDELNLLRNGTNKMFYIINYDTNECLSMNSGFMSNLGMDVNEFTGENPLNDMRIPTFTSLDGLDVSTETVGEQEYDVITIQLDDGYTKYYVERHSDGAYYPVIAEQYVNGKLLTRMNVHEFSADTSAYTTLPSGMKKYSLSNIADLKGVLSFFENLGMGDLDI